MILVKIGGGETINLSAIVADLAELREAVLIVHGANATRDHLASKLNMPKTVITSASGHSSVYSDGNAIDLLMMAYAGLRNKRIVELCQQHGINAVGLTGLDGRVVQGRRNTGIRARENGRTKVVRDLSGKPVSANVELLRLLMERGYTPVLTVPIVDETGVAINSENDDIVRVIANECRVDTVLQLIEAPGFLKDAADPESVIRVMKPCDIQEWEARAEGRMKRKLMALRLLLTEGSARVIIADGRTEHPVRDALGGAGTVVREG